MAGELVLPFYVVADVSYSMTQSIDGQRTPLEALNTVIPAVKDALDENPILGDKVRFAFLDFSDDAQTKIPLCDLMKIESAQIPVLAPRGGTSFVAAFRAVQSQIDHDVRQLRADGHKLHRPAVFFLTDGEPTDAEQDWKAAFAALTDASFKPRPNVIPFGVGEAKKSILDQIVFPPGKMRSFVAKDGIDPADAIRSMAEILIASVLASANSVSEDGQAGGFVMADPEDDDDWL